MKILKKLFARFGFRWSLYLTKENKTLYYALHADSPIDLLGHVRGYFIKSGQPKEPWELYLNFNIANRAYIKLEPHHFLSGSNYFAKELIQPIERIDSNWKTGGREPVFIDVQTKAELPLADVPSFEELQRRIYAGEPDPITLHSVLSDIFRE